MLFKYGQMRQRHGRPRLPSVFSSTTSFLSPTTWAVLPVSSVVSARCGWWPGTESNRRRQPFQGCLPSRLSRCNHMRAQRLHRLRVGIVWASLGRFRMLDVSVLCPRSKGRPGAREFLPPANLPVVRARSDCVTQPRGSSTKASNGGSLPICALRRSSLSTSSRPSQIRFRPSTLSPVNIRQFTWNIEVSSLERRWSSPRGMGFAEAYLTGVLCPVLKWCSGPSPAHINRTCRHPVQARWVAGTVGGRNSLPAG